ncbi:TPA: DUF6270 domain-containing protein [Vibrio metschnikovii]
MSFVVFGGCCSVDAFYSDEGKKSGLLLEKQFARSSLITIFSKKPDTKFDISSISSNFQKRMLSYDLEKNLLPELLLLLKDSDKFLLLDFLVERFNLIKMPCGSLLTHNNEIKNILTVSNIGEFELIDKFSEEKLNLFKKYWCEFWRLAHEYGFANRIILNKLFMTKKNK